MTTILNDKPVIGVISGAASSILYSLKGLLTNDGILKYVAGAGIWLGIAVAVLTLYLRILEIKKVHSKSDK